MTGRRYAANECGVALLASIVKPARRAAGRGRGGGEWGVNDFGAADLVRDRLGEVIVRRVAGPQGAERRWLINAPGERWFAEDRPIRRVHGDSSMFIGGITALLLQSLHPLAMAAVAGHSGYRGDPWGRLQRTSYFLGVTTLGRASDAREAIARVRAIHPKNHRPRAGRPAVRGVRSAPADLGSYRRSRQLPARACPLWRPPLGPGRTRRLRRRPGQDRRRTRRARPAAHRSRPRRPHRRLPG